jgi:RNA polymerase sigma factor (sigma-70 family)
VRDLAVLLLHLLATVARLAGPGGARSVVAESVLVKHQLLIVQSVATAVAQIASRRSCGRRPVCDLHTAGPVDPFRDRLQTGHAVELSSGAGSAEISPTVLVEAAIDLDRALEALATVDPRKAKVVELRFFGGLSVEETANVLHLSTDTIKRDWRLAKLWLLRELEGPAHDRRS